MSAGVDKGGVKFQYISNAGSMLVHCLRRWPFIDPALVSHVVCAGGSVERPIWPGGNGFSCVEAGMWISAMSDGSRGTGTDHRSPDTDRSRDPAAGFRPDPDGPLASNCATVYMPCSPCPHAYCPDERGTGRCPALTISGSLAPDH